MGDLSEVSHLQPMVITGVEDVIGIAAGEYYSVALTKSGEVWAWGLNNYGQLGRATKQGKTNSPVLSDGIAPTKDVQVIVLAAGTHRTMALKSDGTIWATGANSAGQIGNSTTTNQLSFVQVSGLGGVQAIASGAAHSLALKADGSVWAWGDNTYGQIGNDSVINVLTPVKVAGRMQEIAGGWYHSMALKEDGSVWTWGLNTSGQLGDNTYVDSHVPKQIDLLRHPESLVFYRTSGTDIIGPDGNPFLIHAININNGVWNNVAPDNTIRAFNPTTEEDYEAIEEMGFNTVRFLINYKIFVNGYTNVDGKIEISIREAGFEWLNQNLAWAEAHGIKLILNMHLPTGEWSWKSEDANLPDSWAPPAFWTDITEVHPEMDTAQAYQERLALLWQEIARRYVDNNNILGYGLLNEPNIIYTGSKSRDEILEIWRVLAQKLADTIRTQDQNHMLFVEKAICGKRLEWSAGKPTYKLDYYLNLPTNNFVEIKDELENIVYEFHNYNPFEVLGSFNRNVQNAAQDKFPENMNEIWNYPNEHLAITWRPENVARVLLTDRTIFATNNPVQEPLVSFPSNLNSSSYQSQFSTWFSPPAGANVAKVCIRPVRMGQGIGYMDDIKVEELTYDENGTALYSQIILSLDFNKPQKWDSVYNSGTQEISGLLQTSGGMIENGQSSGCLKIANTGGVTGDSIIGQINYISLVIKPGCKYRISSKTRTEGLSTVVDAALYPSLDFYTRVHSAPYTKEGIRMMLTAYKGVANSFNAPLFIGEFGAYVGKYDTSTSSLNIPEWVADTIDVCKEEGISFSYFDFFSNSFGLYHSSNYGMYKPRIETNGVQRNDALAQVFKNHLGD